MKRGVQADWSWDVYAGDANRERFEFQDSEGQPLDVTGVVVAAQARAVDTDPAPALTATVEMTDPPAGVVHIAWDGEDVRALLADSSTWRGVYDVQILPAGQTLPDTLVRGAMRAQMDVTRP